jgi:hypothetical protein
MSSDLEISFLSGCSRAALEKVPVIRIYAPAIEESRKIMTVLVRAGQVCPLCDPKHHPERTDIGAETSRFRRFRGKRQLKPRRVSLFQGPEAQENPGSCGESKWENRNVFVSGRETRGFRRGE